jgi:hypothetical protein
VSFPASAPAGTWRFAATYNGQAYDTTFRLNSAALVARDDFALTPMDAPVTIAALSNDAAPNAEPLSITALGAPAHGAVSVVGSNLVYTPTVGFLGTDAFTYTAGAGAANAVATVTVRVVAEVHRVSLPMIRR